MYVTKESYSNAVYTSKAQDRAQIIQRRAHSYPPPGSFGANQIPSQLYKPLEPSSSSSMVPLEGDIPDIHPANGSSRSMQSVRVKKEMNTRLDV